VVDSKNLVVDSEKLSGRCQNLSIDSKKLSG